MGNWSLGMLAIFIYVGVEVVYCQQPARVYETACKTT